MNSLSLYLTTVRSLLSPNVPATSDSCRLLFFLRSSLLCCVCSRLLSTPLSSLVSSCQHHVCRACLGSRMRLKPSCSYCKDQSKFVEDQVLSLLLNSYAQLCSFLQTHNEFLTLWSNETFTTDDKTLSIAQLIEEGAAYNDSQTTPAQQQPDIQSSGMCFSRSSFHLPLIISYSFSCSCVVSMSTDSATSCAVDFDHCDQLTATTTATNAN